MDPKGHVIVLDEDPLLRPLLEHWLVEEGYRVAAGKAPDEGAPALVIADIPHPQSAEKLIESLREYAAPVLLLSARFRRGLAGSADVARRLGVKKVLPKPFTRTEFLSAVNEALQGSP